MMGMLLQVMNVREDRFPENAPLHRLVTAVLLVGVPDVGFRNVIPFNCLRIPRGVYI